MACLIFEESEVVLFMLSYAGQLMCKSLWIFWVVDNRFFRKITLLLKVQHRQPWNLRNVVFITFIVFFFKLCSYDWSTFFKCVFPNAMHLHCPSVPNKHFTAVILFLDGESQNLDVTSFRRNIDPNVQIYLSKSTS